jgi:hypothetical protein
MAKIAAAKGAQVEVCPGNYTLQPLFPPAGTNLLIDDGVNVNSSSGYGPYQPMVAIEASNITIKGKGPLFNNNWAMPIQWAINNANSDQDTNQYNHAFYFGGTNQNAVLSGVRVTKCGGDGTYVNDFTNVLIDNVDVSGCIRNGGSITGGTANVTVSNSNFHGNGVPVAGVVGDGWDNEPNNKIETILGAKFINDKFAGNRLDGFCGCFGINPAKIQISVVNSISSGGSAGGQAWKIAPSSYTSSFAGTGNTPTFP